MNGKWTLNSKWDVIFLAAFAFLFTTACDNYVPDKKEEAVSATKQENKKARMIYGQGYVRGIGQITLKNKYAGFVSKVHFYSQALVKKGDVILEYDDYDLRVKLQKAKNDIIELEKGLNRKKLELEIKKIDPLPSDYRNIMWKEFAAEQLQKRLFHENKVYKELYLQRCISELDYLRKEEEYKSAEADFKKIIQDKKRVSSGLDKMHIATVEKDIEILELEIANRKAELKLLEEEKKYYKIVAPFDGLCITNSDSVHGYDPAGTSAAVVHRIKKRIIYAYFEEADVGYIRENGMKARFRSNQYGLKYGYFPVTPYEVKKSRSSYGDKCFFLVKFRIDHEHHPLRIDSTGRVEIFLDEEG